MLHYRSEKALKVAIAQKFRNRPLGEVSYLMFDAIYLKVRHDGSVIDMAVLLAYGITPEGKREILGASMKLSEAKGALARVFAAATVSWATRIALDY